MTASRGFTLFELMIVLVIAAIVMTLAVPNLRGAVQNAALAGAVSDLVSTLNLARSEAVKRKIEVGVCASPEIADQADPEKDMCALTHTSWETGYMIVAGLEDPATPHATGAPPGSWETTRVVAGTKATISSTTSSNSELPVAFNHRGLLIADQIAQFAVCDERGPSMGKIVSIGLTGQVTTQNFPDSATDCGL